MDNTNTQNTKQQNTHKNNKPTTQRKTHHTDQQTADTEKPIKKIEEIRSGSRKIRDWINVTATDL